MRLDYEEAISVGLFDLKITMSNGETIKGGTCGCNKSVTIPNSLKKIEVIFTKCDTYLYLIRFIASDGTLTQIGKENSG